MGWFNEQIKQRKENDNSVFSDSFIGIADAVMGTKISAALGDNCKITKNAIDEILKYYNVKTHEIPDTIRDMNDQLEYLMRPYGIMRRTVNLENGWYKDAIGGMLAILKSDRSVVALIPTGLSGYSFFETGSGKRVKINHKNENLFESEAIAFYKPFPLKKINVSVLMKYIVNTLSISDFVLFGFATLAIILIGLLSPKLNNLIFSDVIGSGSMRLFFAITAFMICVSFSTLLINSVKSLLMTRINTKMDISVQAAVMARILSLPAGFFKNYSSGELSRRAQYINTLCNMLFSTFLSTGLTSLFSLIYISQIFIYAPALVVPALVIILISVVFSIISAFVQMKISKKSMELNAKESGMSYALITGVQKIKLSGAEKRAFAKWGNLYAQGTQLSYNPPTFIKINSVINTAISLIGSIVMYYTAVKSHVSVADYYAFNTAYGMISGAFLALASIALTAAQFKPIIEMAKPIMDAVPEVSEGKQVVTKLSGGIELSNISFRYSENMPLVVNDLSLKIRPGQYVAIVGATGCGKSTLMRLMLGFETPQKGAVYYDGKDLNSIDLKSLRRMVGVVMQNGKLFSGDIYSNITISAPWLKMDEAWKAAELSGIADDIRRMPMGMNTIISEGSGGISGGQRQRLMIARAIAPKPKILMFDEATSALDNLTQKKVSESLNNLKCTRIVIAHRLSTIKQCDRIIYLEKGRIAEDGTYDDLIRKNGKFAELVARQRLDTQDNHDNQNMTDIPEPKKAMA
ncbi:MAG: NHLP bacteriocin export ABC transporter permease/ATPase subunit [Oscillospiraceae bacterium]|nr:NHLP bacteriocin export ABC transporter permease/ATPase subunit [Oscillospiraceae bacterium]